jgi:oligopeptide/dipeptide ABC transporter ATP-binding protein
VTGRILLDDNDVLTMNPGGLRAVRWGEASIVFQGAMHALNPVRRVGQQIEEAIVIHHQAGEQEASVRVGDLLEQVGLPARRAQDYPHELSGGQKQRVMIAMALACSPNLVIADEPTTALDVMVQAQVLALLKELQRELGLAMLFITHDLSVLVEVCDRIDVMYAGKIVEEGPAVDVFAEPAHPYTRELLRSTISLDTTELHSIPGAPPNLIAPPSGCRFHPRCPDAMRVCHAKEPIEQANGDGRRVLCWLHGPDDQIPEGGTAELEREEIAVAEEA